MTEQGPKKGPGSASHAVDQSVDDTTPAGDNSLLVPRATSRKRNVGRRLWKETICPWTRTSRLTRLNGGSSTIHSTYYYFPLSIQKNSKS